MVKGWPPFEWPRSLQALAARREREEQVAQVQMQVALSGAGSAAGASWGFGDDAVDDDGDCELVGLAWLPACLPVRLRACLPACLAGFQCVSACQRCAHRMHASASSPPCRALLPLPPQWSMLTGGPTPPPRGSARSNKRWLIRFASGSCGCSTCSGKSKRSGWVKGTARGGPPWFRRHAPRSGLAGPARDVCPSCA